MTEDGDQMTEDGERRTDGRGRTAEDGKNWLPFSVLCSLSSAICLLTSGCGTAFPGSPQACAGINQAAIAYNAATGQVDAKLCGGKESDHVKLSGETPAGLEFHYEVEGATAFAGQMTQAELSQALSRERAEIMRELIASVKSIAPLLPPAVR